VDVFAALADPVRRDLLDAVAHRPMRVVDLAARQSISRPAISRHLRVLTEAGLLDVEQRGRERHYVLRAAPLHRVRDFIDLLETRRLPAKLTPGALDALDTEVRRTSRDRRRGEGGRSRTRSRTTREDIA
jgi:DNA-binding transcriptional ArsR family regulator